MTMIHFIVQSCSIILKNGKKFVIVLFCLIIMQRNLSHISSIYFHNTWKVIMQFCNKMRLVFGIHQLSNFIYQPPYNNHTRSRVFWKKKTCSHPDTCWNQFAIVIQASFVQTIVLYITTTRDKPRAPPISDHIATAPTGISDAKCDHCPMSGLGWPEISPGLSCWPWTQATPTPKKGRLKFSRTINLGDSWEGCYAAGMLVLQQQSQWSLQRTLGLLKLPLLSWHSHALLQSSQL